MHDELNATKLPDAVAHLFPRTSRVSYLSSCTRGLLPSPARAALDAYLDAVEGGTRDGAETATDRVRAAFAKLIRADPEEIAYTQNVSDGLNRIAAALDWRQGDNIVLCLSLEHPNNIYPWLNLRALHGVEIRSVPDRDGHIDPGAMIAATDARTRLITLSTVTSSPGFRADLTELGAFCRARGIFLMADGIQSVGVLDTDVHALGVDALAVSTQKYLCGLYGLGFLYCRRDWADSLRPAALARASVVTEVSEALGVGLQEHPYRLRPGARRFDVGNVNLPAVVAVEASLGILNALGPEAIDAHVTRLASGLTEGLRALGLPVVGGTPGPWTGSIVSLGRRVSDQHDGPRTDDIVALSQRLTQGGVIHSLRRGMIRFAFHVYNGQDDVDRVLDIAGSHAAAQ